MKSWRTFFFLKKWFYSLPSIFLLQKGGKQNFYHRIAFLKQKKNNIFNNSENFTHQFCFKTVQPQGATNRTTFNAFTAKCNRTSHEILN